MEVHDKKSTGKDLRKLMNQADKLKTSYHQVCAVQGSLDRSIATDSAYEWANTDFIKSRFVLAQQRISTMMDKEAFNKFYITNDEKSTKEKFGAAFHQHVTVFLDMKDAIDALAKEQARFNRMHLANQHA